jgi:integrase
MPLTDAKARAAKPQAKRYELVDGDGLALVVMPSGSKVWHLRYRTQRGERKRVVLGKYPDVGLSVARAESSKLRGRVSSGEDPAAEIASLRVQGETVASVVEQYITEHRPTWKDSTARTYLSAIAAFTDWAALTKVKLATDITPAALGKYRAHAITMTRRIKKKGGGRGDVVATEARRSGAAINCELRAVKTMLQALRKTDHLPSIASSDQITDTLGLLAMEVDHSQPLSPAQLRQLMAACRAHDADDTHEPIGLLVIFMLLSGMRLGEALRIKWSDVDLSEHQIHVAAAKTGKSRRVDLTVSPALHRLLAMRSERADGDAFIFSHTQPTALDARQRLITEFGAPDFLWSTRHSRPGSRSAPTLRSTCGCYLTCAPSIFGAASVYRSAAQLGHSVAVAERHYLGALRRIAATATTLEAAMGIEDEVSQIAICTIGDE